MNRRQRFIETMTFGSPDRPAAGDYFSYDSTRERWEREGLPVGVDLNDYFGFDFDPFRWQLPINWRLEPGVIEEVISEDSEYVIRRQGQGEIVRYLKDEPPPAMPQWLEYPLKTRHDWRAFRQRLDPDTPGRFPADFDRLVERYRLRDYPLGMWGVGSTYGVMRDWWGVEALSMLFYDDPALIEEMVECLTHLHVTLLEKVLSCGVELDWVAFWEDMAYKNGPLVSPDLYRRYCVPLYEAVMEKVRSAGIRVAMVDSDGDIRQLLPLWLDVGITVMHPVEATGDGMSVSEIRREYGRGVCFFGGIDKRALAGSFSDIEREVVPKLRACFADGGFIPACDHAVPPDVSFDNYLYFREIVNRTASEFYQ